MPSITINGQTVEVEEGQNLIQAAASIGVTIPHYCYHPGLSIDGNCRMCLVEVEGARGPQIACNTFVKDGLVVHTDTEAVHKMRKGVMEFLLLNHPIDCPICDQAGECRLQDYYMEYGKYDNRSSVPKVEKAKVVDIGPHVVLDQERCILCQRCTRFCKEVSKTDELVVTGRGDKSRIELFPGTRLDNPYSTNVVDICPVGALTSKDFRFKQRVWFLKETKSVCTGCAKGCNIWIDHNQGITYRYRPRFNEAVNQHWMCDEGRFTYKALHDNRLTEARVSGKAIPIGKALQKVAERLGEVLKGHGPSAIAVVGSPYATLEDNYVLARFAEKAVGTSQVYAPNLAKPGEADDFLREADKSPNARGTQILGLNGDAGMLAEALDSGQIQAVIVMSNNLIRHGGAEWRQRLKKVPFVVALTSHDDEMAGLAQVVLPAAMHAEKYGSYVNSQGRVQRAMYAYEPSEDAAPEWEIVSRLGGLLLKGFGYAELDLVWGELSKLAPFEGLTFHGLGDQGQEIRA